MENAELCNNPLSFELKEKIAPGNQYSYRQLFQLYSKVLLITHKLSGSSAPDEIEELQLVLEHYPKAQSALNVLHNYWKMPESEIDEFQPNEHFQHVLKKAGIKTRFQLPDAAMYG